MAKTGDASELEMAKTGGDAEEGAPAEEEAPKVLSLPVSGRGAHHVTLPSWVPEGVFDAAVEADQFRGFNGVRTNAASAKLELDADQKLVAKHDEEITLEDRGSTAITMFGSLAALVVFLLFVIMICVGWSTQEPVIDELEVETFGARYAMRARARARRRAAYAAEQPRALVGRLAPNSNIRCQVRNAGHRHHDRLRG